MGLPDGEEMMKWKWNAYLRFGTIPARDRRTDKRTDRQTRCDRYYPR